MTYAIPRDSALARAATATVAAYAVVAGLAAVPAAVTATATAASQVLDARRFAALDPGLDLAAATPQAVVVQAVAGAEQAAALAVTRAGGNVGRALPLVAGFAARVPGVRLAALAADPAVRAVTRDSLVRFDAVSYTDAGVASVYPKAAGALTAWQRGWRGRDVGVAVIDTGVSSMNDFGRRVVYGPDLSGEGRTVDSFGHGTVMAGVIAGSGADSETDPGGARAGVAPEATLVSVKVAGRNGASDVSTVLEAMHWVAAYREQFNIRVLNLSWGTNSTADPAVDPLNYAVQRLWQSGIVVVVSAGNGGSAAGTINKPGDDPLVITTGAYDDRGTTDASDDVLATWSGRGPTAHGRMKPDLIAPGRTLVSTRSYGSQVEADNPSALVSPSYIKGSGTSQSAAVVSGLVALLLEARPDLTPDQVKAVLSRSAKPLAGVAVADQGAGRVDVAAALSAPAGPASWQGFRGNGLGSLEGSRGAAHVRQDCDNDGDLDEIAGEITRTCAAWNGGSWTGGSWTGGSWTGGSWTGGSWTGGSWTGGSWTGGSWTGGSWTDASWTGGSWTGGSWTGGSWTGGSWTGGSWTGGSWTGGSWTGAEWSGAEWSGGSWTGGSWTGGSWTGGSWTGGSWTGGSWTGGSWTSASYGDGGEGGLLDVAWWGNKPRFWQQVPGEVSDALPAGCAWSSTLVGDDPSPTRYVQCVDSSVYAAVTVQ